MIDAHKPGMMLSENRFALFGIMPQGRVSTLIWGRARDNQATNLLDIAGAQAE
jgi:hypothetical protein